MKRKGGEEGGRGERREKLLDGEGVGKRRRH